MESISRESPRSRRRSESPSSPTRGHRDKRDGDYHLRMREGFRVEVERISGLSMKERMTEDAQEVLRRLEREPTTTILLQPCSRRWAGCAAGKCAIADVLGDDYRVVLGSRNRRYFHISRMEAMVELVSLPPSRFKLDTGTRGLICGRGSSTTDASIS